LQIVEDIGFKPPLNIDCDDLATISPFKELAKQ
jgi:hypothetical protein